MATTVRGLITNSWYLSSIVARGYETVSGEQMTDGLRMLNALLSIKSADQRMIPYYKQYNFSGVVGQEKYFIPKLLLAESLTFNIDTVRYSMTLQARRQYFGLPRANAINSLPFEYHLERTKGGSDLYMYFTPQQAYSFELWGKFSLDDVTLDQDLSLLLDQYYIDYLTYGLAEYMCQDYNITFQPQNEKQLKYYESVIFDISPIDFTMTKSSIFQKPSGQDIYGQVNIGHGYTTG